MNAFLAEAASAVREVFGGRVSYASIPFEGIHWALSTSSASTSTARSGSPKRYREGVRALVGTGKPVAITEFGCATFRGAADRGASGGMIVEYQDARPSGLSGEHARDESEQARYVRELLDLFAAEGVDTAVVNPFACYHLPHRADPHEDLDVASFGVVKVLEAHLGRAYPGIPWEPKAAFATLADFYGGSSTA